MKSGVYRGLGRGRDSLPPSRTPWQLAICRAAAAEGVPYMLPTLSSCTLEEMLAEGKKFNTNLFTQLCVLMS